MQASRAIPGGLVLKEEPVQCEPSTEVVAPEPSVLWQIFVPMEVGQSGLTLPICRVAARVWALKPPP